MECGRGLLFLCVCLYAEIDVKYSPGLVSLSIPLPSHRERCAFSFPTPVMETITDLVSQLKLEDEGIYDVAVYSHGSYYSMSSSHHSVTVDFADDGWAIFVVVVVC